MCKKIFYLLTAITLGVSAISAKAQTASVSTIPGGVITFSLPQGAVSYLSLPLSNNDAYIGTVSYVAPQSITVTSSNAFTSSLATAAAPYFLKFLSGNEMGRVMLITANTANTLTLDTSDGLSGTQVILTTTNFTVQAGDTFEIFPGDTLASVFGDGSSDNPLVLTGGANVHSSDTISLYATTSSAVGTYYFNTSNGYWEQYGATTNANNTIIYPYSALSIERRSNHATMTFALSGRVTPVATKTKVISEGTVYTSSHYPTGITLSQLQFGSNWTTGTSPVVADTVGVWNATTGQVTVFYQEPNSTWREYPNTTTDQSSYVIAPGAVMTITKREIVTGATAFLDSALPYSMD